MRPLKLTIEMGPTGVGTAVLAVMCLLVAGGIILAAAGLYGAGGLLLVVFQDLPVSLAIFAAAGGWGWLLIHRLARPERTSAGLLAVTSVAAGLWLLSTALLGAGAFASGLLTPLVWWPVVGVGLMLAAWACRRRIASSHVPRTVPIAALLSLLAAAAAGLWLAGATMPAGKIGLVEKDFYDVVSYHLQAPREFYLTGRTEPLEHNTYSHYPLGGEMLFLLGMILKGGPWAGVFTAKLTHGLWGALAVAAVYFAPPPAQRWRRRAAAVLLVSAPMAIYLSWLAFVELSELAYLAVGIAWLIRWLDRPGFRAALLIGLAAGGACAIKYLSVGLVAAPLLAVMLVASLRRPVRALQGLAAAAVCLALLGPWLIRNERATGNPVFPLATGVFGAGPWSAEQAARWDAAHAPPPLAGRLKALGSPFVTARGFGLAFSAMAAAAVLILAIHPRRSDPIDRACTGILAVQLAVWIFATHMPGRFLIPAAVPMCLLAGGLIARLRRWGEGGESPDAVRPKPWTQPVAVALLVLVAAAGILTGWELYRLEQVAAGAKDGHSNLHGMFPDELAALPGNRPIYAPLAGGRLLLVGDVRPFNSPANTLYASIWEIDPMTQVARQSRDPHEIIRRLRDTWGVTHLLINWEEIRRLRRTYDWPTDVDRPLIDSLFAAGARDLRIPSPTYPDGRPIVQMLELPRGH